MADQRGECSVSKLIACEPGIDIIPIPVLAKDLSGVIIDCNTALAELFALTKEEIVGHTSAELVTFPEREQERIDREYRQMLNGEVESFEKVDRRFVDNNGNQHFVIHNKTLVKDEAGEPQGFLISLIDQTKHHNLEAKLWEELNFNMLILETAESLIMVLDEHRNILRFNTACETTSGYMLVEVIGTKFEERFVREADRVRIAQMLSLEDDHLVERGIELQFDALDGSVRTVSWSFAGIEEDGSSKCILAVGNDITEQKRAEREALEKQKMLVQAEKLTSLGTLVAGVAHEVNNPNNFIMFNAPQLEDIWDDLTPVLKSGFEQSGTNIDGMDYEELDTFVRELFNGINQGASRIKQIVKNLKDYVQDKPADLTATVSVDDVISGAMMLLKNPIAKATDKFSISIESNIPDIKGDLGMIEQVLINLVQNACHALPDRQSLLSVEAYCGETNIVISVVDGGSGIPDKVLKFITDPFFTTKRDSGGTGLGLSISSNIMKEHGGELVVESERGIGTTAKMLFPLN